MGTFHLAHAMGVARCFSCEANFLVTIIIIQLNVNNSVVIWLPRTLFFATLQNHLCG